MASTTGLYDISIGNLEKSIASFKSRLKQKNLSQSTQKKLNSLIDKYNKQRNKTLMLYNKHKSHPNIIGAKKTALSYNEILKEVGKNDWTHKVMARITPKALLIGTASAAAVLQVSRLITQFGGTQAWANIGTFIAKAAKNIFGVGVSTLGSAGWTAALGVLGGVAAAGVVGLLIYKQIKKKKELAAEVEHEISEEAEEKLFSNKVENFTDLGYSKNKAQLIDEIANNKELKARLEEMKDGSHISAEQKKNINILLYEVGVKELQDKKEAAEKENLLTALDALNQNPAHVEKEIAVANDKYELKKLMEDIENTKDGKEFKDKNNKVDVNRKNQYNKGKDHVLDKIKSMDFNDYIDPKTQQIKLTKLNSAINGYGKTEKLAPDVVSELKNFAKEKVQKLFEAKELAEKYYPIEKPSGSTEPYKNFDDINTAAKPKLDSDIKKYEGEGIDLAVVDKDGKSVTDDGKVITYKLNKKVLDEIEKVMQSAKTKS